MKLYNPNTHDSFVMQFGFPYPKWRVKRENDLITIYPSKK
jgi:hypothetical protein|tara:strand:+ start:2251 stop:2370 length:120 start_codon:yes stop_codon:yes gene_type:complete